MVFVMDFVVLLCVVDGSKSMGAVEVEVVVWEDTEGCLGGNVMEVSGGIWAPYGAPTVPHVGFTCGTHVTESMWDAQKPAKFKPVPMWPAFNPHGAHMDTLAGVTV